ncbi:MAG: glycine cleavage system protein GcvH [Bacteriovoracales bacterium]|nr:glycine cleavage system protein GcvH [Bacteriovoracales bacterium]
MSGHQVPENLKYTKEHEWIQIDDDCAAIGITDYAQSSLGDIVFVELPEVGRVLKQGETFGVVESIKSVSDLYSPLAGEVIEVNTQLENSPELCNEAPYDHWMIKIKLPATKDHPKLSSLLNHQEYKDLCRE